MVKIILPVCIRVFRAVDKNIFVLRRMNGYHADMRAVSRTVDRLNLARTNIDPLNGFTGKRRAGRADIIDKPLAVWRPVLMLVSWWLREAKVICFMKIP